MDCVCARHSYRGRPLSWHKKYFAAALHSGFEIRCALTCLSARWQNNFPMTTSAPQWIRLCYFVVSVQIPADTVSPRCFHVSSQNLPNEDGNSSPPITETESLIQAIYQQQHDGRNGSLRGPLRWSTCAQHARISLCVRPACEIM